MRAFLAPLLLLQLLEAADLHKATKFTAESDLTEQEKATIERRKTDRKDQFVVGIQENAFPTKEVPPGVKEVLMTSAAGQKMRCLLPDGTGPPNKEISSAKETESFTEAAAEANDKPRGDVVEHLRAQLGKRCLSKKVDYWTYEVCPFSHAEQYHKENGKKHMQFDLGLFVKPSNDELDSAQLTKPHKDLPDYSQAFEGGTQGRSSTLVFRCSPGASEPVLFSVKEPSELRYVFVIQTSLVCFEKADMTESSVFDLLLPFQNQCVFLNTGWWTYKHCHLLNMTQFHRENRAVVNPDTKEQSTSWVMLAEFGLGELPKLTSAEKRAYGKLFVADKPEETYVSYRYKGGTPCDISSKEQRETEVRWYCDPEETNALMGVEEVKTCKYMMKVVARNLCSHPAFAPVKPLVHEIDCRPLEDDDNEEEGNK